MKRIVIVSGLSGAGKSSVLKILEDSGFEVIDNLPLSVLPQVIADTADNSRVAVGIDARTRDFDCDKLCLLCSDIKKDKNIAEKIIFLECDDEQLLRRFTETRRSHPLAKNKKLSDGIALERTLMAPLRQKADLIIDTTEMKIAQLRAMAESEINAASSKELVVSVMSFSYREGLPRESDLVFDVRFLRNPYYDPELRPLTGKDKRIGAYIEQDPDYPSFFNRLTEFLRPLLPRFLQEGKSRLTIAVGCTGGKHRSVYIAEQLYKWLLSQKTCIVTLAHRELDKIKQEK
ncbi:MAG: RNase adapter RapZ [Alphaproteobacteria bacterium]|nr:RNase adapter RapZ [Alphaproteobacteria bacterium]